MRIKIFPKIAHKNVFNIFLKVIALSKCQILSYKKYASKKSKTLIEDGFLDVKTEIIEKINKYIKPNT